jgi:trans-aconitate 2-methyltransferase
MPWDPELYERFRAQREEPFFDLLSMVKARAEMRVLDLGCGTGRQTAVLHQRLRAASTLGLDSSASMLDGAPTAPGLSFLQARIEDFEPEGRYDLIFSNAALHWVEDQPATLARICSWLKPDGQLAVQVPANFDHPAHRLAAQLGETLGGYARGNPVLAPEDYSRCLFQLGMRPPRVRLEVYPHELPGWEAVLEWVSGTLLVDYRDRLGEPVYKEFARRYALELERQIGFHRPYLFAFKRILMWAEMRSIS